MRKHQNVVGSPTPSKRQFIAADELAEIARIVQHGYFVNPKHAPLLDKYAPKNQVKGRGRAERRESLMAIMRRYFNEVAKAYGYNDMQEFINSLLTGAVRNGVHAAAAVSYDGSISVKAASRGCLSVSVEVTNTDPMLIVKAAAACGYRQFEDILSHTYCNWQMARENVKPCFHFCVKSGDEAFRLCALIYKYGEGRKQRIADCAMSYLCAEHITYSSMVRHWRWARVANARGNAKPDLEYPYAK